MADGQDLKEGFRYSKEQENPVNDLDGFALFMKESSFSVCDDYHGLWEFIKTELHSLERYSTFGIELPPVSAVKAEQSWAG